MCFWRVGTEGRPGELRKADRLAALEGREAMSKARRDGGWWLDGKHSDTQAGTQAGRQARRQVGRLASRLAGSQARTHAGGG